MPSVYVAFGEYVKLVPQRLKKPSQMPQGLLSVYSHHSREFKFILDGLRTRVLYEYGP